MRDYICDRRSTLMKFVRNSIILEFSNHPLHTNETTRVVLWARLIKDHSVLSPDHKKVSNTIQECFSLISSSPATKSGWATLWLSVLHTSFETRAFGRCLTTHLRKHGLTRFPRIRLSWFRRWSFLLLTKGLEARESSVSMLPKIPVSLVAMNVFTSSMITLSVQYFISR